MVELPFTCSPAGTLGYCDLFPWFSRVIMRHLTGQVFLH